MAEFLRIYKDAFDHDDGPDGKTRWKELAYGGPPMWMYALYSLCNLNPMGNEVFEDYMLDTVIKFHEEGKRGYATDLRFYYDNPNSAFR